MNSKDLARYLVLGGALAGLTVGTQLRATTVQLSPNNGSSTTIQLGTPAATDTAAAADKHACKGLNACKGHGNCKTGDKGCAGKNSCKGHGGCASKDAKHDCAGKNACKGMGAGGK